MKQIIPAILTEDISELRFKLESVSGLVGWVQVDIMDNEFVPNKSISISDIADIEHNSDVSAHLMVKNPQKYLDDCKASGVGRVVFHYESTDDHQMVLDEIDKRGMEKGIAINPETSTDVLTPLVNQLDVALLLGVTPGFGGQEFIPETLDKIKALREVSSDLFIAVDGGITEENISAISEAGADGFVVGSTIYKNNDIKTVIKNLQDKVS